MNREKWIKGFKFALASVIAIALAELFQLKYATTAGIITILSIQNTKLETFRVAGHRAAAFVCALIVAAVSFGLFGFTIPAFAVYLFVFARICLFLDWAEAISMCSVLVSHFLTEKSMAPAALLNETLLFIIGAGLGILANLHLHHKTDEFDRLAEKADEGMCAALEAVARQLTAASGSKEAAEGQKAAEEMFENLEISLKALQECAHRNWNNTLFARSAYETGYSDMRSSQAKVLKRILTSAGMLEVIPAQAALVAQLLMQIRQEYHRNNTTEALLESLKEVYENMRKEPLPMSRQEFEARAVLFYVLKQVEEFLQLKHRFAMEHAAGGQ